MTLRMDCPACGQALVLDDGLSGRSVRCPSCDRVVSTAGLARSQGIASRPQPPGAASRRMEPDAAPRRRSARAPRSNPSMAGLILGIIALVLGVPALIISWIPLLCVVGLVLAGIGLLVGVVGIAMAAMNRGDGLSVSITGGGLNLVALLIGLFMTFVSGALMSTLNDTAGTDGSSQTTTTRPADKPGAGGVPAGGVAAGWGQKIDPDGDCTFQEQGAALDITVPPTAHDLSAELQLTNAPRMLQEVIGDFTVQVKVSGTIQPLAGATVQGRIPYQAGGLLVWSDEGSYLRLERAGMNVNGLSTHAAFEMRINGQRGRAHTVAIPDQDTYLRLERHGNEFRALVSSDGQQWRALPSLHAPFPARVQVGVAVINAAQKELQVRFENLRLDK